MGLYRYPYMNTRCLHTDGVQFDRFGLFSPGVGGSRVKIYFDDLDYTAK